MTELAYVIGAGIVLWAYFFHTKKAIIATGVIAAPFIVFFAYLFAHSKLAEMQREKEISSILIFAKADLGFCSNPAWPIRVTATNMGSTTINAFQFTLVAHKQGYSDPVHEDSLYRSDKILSAGETTDLCWAVSKYRIGSAFEDMSDEAVFLLVDDYVWSANVTSVEMAK